MTTPNKPKMTAKYKTALHTAKAHGIAVSQEQETLYRRLNDDGFWWDSDQQQWIEFANEPADAPIPFVKVRVWAESGAKLDQAVRLIEAAFAQGFSRINKSLPYPCRPPKQLEARVYLDFLPDGKTAGDIIRDNDPFAIEIE